MQIIESTYYNHPEEVEYELIISTDSSRERDIIKKHLALAEQEYKDWIRKITKGD